MSTTGTVKVCKTLNQNSLTNGNFDKIDVDEVRKEAIKKIENYK